jgi:hypothetical protein
MDRRQFSAIAQHVQGAPLPHLRRQRYFTGWPPISNAAQQD